MKKTHDIVITNLISDGIELVGTAFKSSLSFMLTLLCCVSDYMQTFVLLDAVMKESEAFVIITTTTLTFFLNFSMFFAAQIIKRISCNRPLRGKKWLSVVTIMLCFVIFFSVFLLTFQFKYALRETLFSLDNSGVDGVINRAVQAGTDIINQSPSITISQTRVVQIAAILCGCLPCLTSLASLISVFVMYDPIANEQIVAKGKLLFF